jgi:general secretion pathway protein K
MMLHAIPSHSRGITVLTSYFCQRAKSRHGSALMLMIWAVVLMSFTVGGLVQYMKGSVQEASIVANQARALYQAESGLALGLHPKYCLPGKSMKSVGNANSGFEVLVTTEGARMPINYITDERAKEAIYNLFIYWGLDAENASTVADSLADWVDQDTEVRAQGAEEDYYKGLGYYDLPKQRGFTSVEEMLLVRGMDLVARAKPDWRDYFSINSDGLIDLSTAKPDVIVAVTGANQSDLERYITERDGADGIFGTQDDRRNTSRGAVSQNAALYYLGITQDKMASIIALTTTTDRVMRIESTGHVGLVKVKVTVVAKRQDDGSLTYFERVEE